MHQRFIFPATVAAGVHAAILFGFGSGAPPAPSMDAAAGKTPPTYVPFHVADDPPPPDDTKDERPRGNASSRPMGEEAWTQPKAGDIAITIPRTPVRSDPAVARIEPGLIGVPGGALEGGEWNSGPIVKSGELDRLPRTRVQVRPVYPASARSAGRGAEVTVDFVVDEQGRVESVRVVRTTDQEFEAVTLQAVAKWRFEPGRKNGVPVRFRMVVPVVFSLSE